MGGEGRNRGGEIGGIGDMAVPAMKKTSGLQQNIPTRTPPPPPKKRQSRAKVFETENKRLHTTTAEIDSVGEGDAWVWKGFLCHGERKGNLKKAKIKQK